MADVFGGDGCGQEDGDGVDHAVSEATETYGEYHSAGIKGYVLRSFVVVAAILTEVAKR